MTKTSQWVSALDGLVLDLILLEDALAAAFAHYDQVGASVQLVGSQYELIISQLVGTLGVVALESDLVQILLLEFVDWFQHGTVNT
jgi:hypothetical protein